MFVNSLPKDPYIYKDSAQALSGHRVVKYSSPNVVDYASASVLSDCLKIAGLTTGASNAGAKIRLLVQGEIVEPSWSWITNVPVYLGENGVLTQTPPSGGNILIAGMAISPTSLFFNPGAPIALN